MGKKSAGILVYRSGNNGIEVLLVHPGGPFFVKKDAGAWSIPKGEFTSEEPLHAAKREFLEETGTTAEGNFWELQPVKLKSGKVLYAWTLEADVDAEKMKSNLFEIEWPPRSGKKESFPEIDKAQWFTIAEAKLKMNVAQTALLDELAAKLETS